MKQRSRKHPLKRRILLSVTADRSLGLMRGFPEYLAGQGWEVHVVSSPGPRSEELKQQKNVYVHNFSMSRNPSPLHDLRSFVSWLRILRSIQPDVVAVGTPKAGLLGSVAAWMLRVPERVYIVRGLRLETTQGMLRRVLKFMEWVTFATSTRALSVSSSLKEEVVRLGLVRTDKVSVLGLGSSNGVDVERFQPRNQSDPNIVKLRTELGLEENLPVIGFVGRLNTDKGLGLLGESLLSMATISTKFQLLLVGGQDGEITEHPDLFGEDLHVVSTGQVPDTSPYYALIDILCLPTRREGFPNVVLEAAASGVPTVTTNATGAIDSVVHEETGLIVEKNSAEGLALALSKLVDDQELRSSMGVRARAWAVENFERTKVWRNTEKYFRGDSVDAN